MPRDKEINLYLDNADGHGTEEAVEMYVNNLARNHNLICVHQRPRSPESNMLDLGVWMAFQNVVEQQHIGCMKEANCLTRTVDAAWTGLEPVELENIWNR